MEDWLKCQISPLVKYRQNQNQRLKRPYLRSRAIPPALVSVPVETLYIEG